MGLGHPFHKDENSLHPSQRPPSPRGGSRSWGWEVADRPSLSFLLGSPSGLKALHVRHAIPS